MQFDIYKDYAGHSYVIELHEIQRRISFFESDDYVEQVKQEMVREHRRLTIDDILTERKEKIEKILK